ncbi:response regulator [Ampullimonas aquatilis]|uniref:response regulator n=1 Tax=Ampullimonas aquatilis TaxID=1341549 RepID=UPI003C76E501
MTTATKVLIVDDDQAIRELLSSYLQNYQIDAQAVADGTAMWQALEQQVFDLIILDLMLPGEDGLSLCRQLRQRNNLPIIMLTARGEATDKIVGLELGADDYIVKPFEPREIVARINTILRRTRHQDAPGKKPGKDIVHFEGWQLNRTTRQLTTSDGMVVPLSNAEFRLLWVFIEHPQQVLDRDQLMDAARGRTTEAFDRSIDLLVSRVRQKLADNPKSPALIKTIRGEGYLFDARVQS